MKRTNRSWDNPVVPTLKKFLQEGGLSATPPWRDLVTEAYGKRYTLLKAPENEVWFWGNHSGLDLLKLLPVWDPESEQDLVIALVNSGGELTIRVSAVGMDSHYPAASRKAIDKYVTTVAAMKPKASPPAPSVPSSAFATKYATVRLPVEQLEHDMALSFGSVIERVESYARPTTDGRMVYKFTMGDTVLLSEIHEFDKRMAKKAYKIELQADTTHLLLYVTK